MKTEEEKWKMENSQNMVAEILQTRLDFSTPIKETKQKKIIKNDPNKEDEAWAFSEWKKDVPGREGSYCYIERVFTESKAFSFTSGEKIKSPADVAYIFKNLEDSSIENCFVVFVKNEKPTVLHVGMGTFTHTAINLSAIKAGYEAIKPDKVYIAHNHPSGALKASLDDIKMLKTVRDMLPQKGLVQDGIIINLRSGQFGVFDGSLKRETNALSTLKDVEKEVELKLYSFDKQVFEVGFNPHNLNQIRSNVDVASFISSHRLGDRAKISFLLLSNDSRVVGNIHTEYNTLEGGLSEKIAMDCIHFGGNAAILYGNCDFSKIKTLKENVNKASGGDVHILDAISINRGSGEYLSVADRGMMEPRETYNKYTPEEIGIIEKATLEGSFLKAPNGELSCLSPKQWVQVRTEKFKDWFGDWEKTARIEKLRKSEVIEITGKEISPSEDLHVYRKNALEYGKGLRGEYVNKDTGEKILLARNGIGEILRHDSFDTPHLQSIASIPQIIEQSIYIDSLKNESKTNASNVSEYSYYVIGLKIGGVDHTAKAVIAKDKDGNRYYDHKLTQIEKGKLLDEAARITSPPRQKETSLSEYKDKRLTSILQTNSSKVIHKNGEPLVVYHGTRSDKEFTIFDENQKAHSKDKGFFLGDKATAQMWENGRMIEAFVNIKNPYDINVKYELNEIRDEYEKETLEELTKRYSGLDTRDFEPRKGATAYFDDNTHEIYDRIRENNNDGIIINAPDGTLLLNVFESSQIKSATCNNGQFNKAEPDIMKESQCAYVVAGKEHNVIKQETKIPAAISGTVLSPAQRINLANGDTIQLEVIHKGVKRRVDVHMDEKMKTKITTVKKESRVRGVGI